MAKQTVNLGTSPNKGDGDPIRTAMRKINENFDELYAGNFADPANTASNLIPSEDSTYDLGSATNQWADLHVSDFIYLGGSRLEITGNGSLLVNGASANPVEVQDVQGSVFGDDSTTLVDAVNNVINLDGTVSGHVIPDEDVAYDLGSATHRFRDIYLSGNTIDLDGTTISVAGGNLQVSGVDIKDVVTAAGVDFTDLTNRPTTLSGFGITDAYTQAEVDAAIAAQQHLPVGDLVGSVFADDSTLLVDGVNGKLVGDYENGTSTIGSTRVESYDIKAFQDTNTHDLYVANTIWGGETGTIKNVSIGSLPPSTSNGASGDRSGMIAFDSTYIYYCTASYTDGVADIWKRVAWLADTW